MNKHIVRAAAKALNSSSQHHRNFTIPRSWIQSLYHRMGYSSIAGTIAQLPVSQGLYDECRWDFENYSKLRSTPSSHISVGKSATAATGLKTVPIKGISDKRARNVNFIVTLLNEFLPMQVVYSGKTKASQPRDFNFPPGFCITQNLKHWSNDVETLQEIISLNIVKKRVELKLAEDHKALLI